MRSRNGSRASRHRQRRKHRARFATTRRSRNNPLRRKMQIRVIEWLLMLMRTLQRRTRFRKPQRQQTCRIQEGWEGIRQRGGGGTAPFPLGFKNPPREEPGEGGRIPKPPPDCTLLCFPTKLIRRTESIDPLGPSLVGVSWSSRSLDLSPLSNNLENNFCLADFHNPPPRRYPQHLDPESRSELRNMTMTWIIHA